MTSYRVIYIQKKYHNKHSGSPQNFFTGPVQNFPSLTHTHFLIIFLPCSLSMQFSFLFLVILISCTLKEKNCKPYFRGLRTTSWSFLTFFSWRGVVPEPSDFSRATLPPLAPLGLAVEWRLPVSLCAAAVTKRHVRSRLLISGYFYTFWFFARYFYVCVSRQNMNYYALFRVQNWIVFFSGILCYRLMFPNLPRGFSNEAPEFVSDQA